MVCRLACKNFTTYSAGRNVSARGGGVLGVRPVQQAQVRARGLARESAKVVAEVGLVEIARLVREVRPGQGCPRGCATV